MNKTPKIYKMNQCDWWIDYSPSEAKTNYTQFTGISDNEDENYHYPIELTPNQLNKLTFLTENNTKITFQEELNNRIKNNDIPSFFASTEY